MKFSKMNITSAGKSLNNPLLLEAYRFSVNYKVPPFSCNFLHDDLQILRDLTSNFLLTILKLPFLKVCVKKEKEIFENSLS